MPLRITLAVVVGAALLVAWLLFFEESPGPNGDAVRTAESDSGAREAAGLAGRTGNTGRRDSSSGTRHDTTQTEEALTEQTANTVTEGTVVFRGVVVNRVGKPVADADVTLVSAGKQIVGHTNATGGFELETPAGRYALTITSPEGGTLHRPSFNVDGAGRDEPFQLVVGLPLHLHLTRGAQALAGARIHVVPSYRATQRIDRTWRQLADGATHVLTTDAQGDAYAENLARGGYTLFVEFAPTTLVRVQHEHDSDRIHTIAMLQPTTMEGRVTAGLEGAGIFDAEVTFQGYGGHQETQFVATARTAGEGRFALEIPRIHCFNPFVHLRVEAEGYNLWVSGGMSSSNKELVNKHRPVFDALFKLPSGAPGELHIPLRHASRPRVTGRVFDASGAPVPGARLRLQYALGRTRGDVASLVCDAEGTFVIERLAPSQYRVVATDDAWYGWSKKFSVPYDQVEPVHIELKLTKAVEVSGRVVLPDGRGVVGARVWISRRRHQSLTGVPNPTVRRTGADGRFSIGGLRKGHSGCVCASWGTLQAIPIFVINHRQNRQNVRLELREAITLRGRVVEKGTGRPIPRAYLRFEPTRIEGDLSSREPGGRSKFSTVCDLDGVFRVVSLLPGVWRLAPRSARMLVAEPSIHDWRERSGVIDVEIELDPGRIVFGRVENSVGEPLAAQITIGKTLINSVNGEPFRIQVKNMKPDIDGRFRITGMGVEPLWMSVYAKGYVRRELDEIDEAAGALQIVMESAR